MSDFAEWEVQDLQKRLTQLEAEIKDRANCEQSLTRQLLDIQTQRDTAYELLRELRSCSGCMVAHGEIFQRIDALLSPEEHQEEA